MIQSAKAQNIDLRYLIDNFRLQRVREPDFFAEWEENLPELSPAEKEQLDKVREGYFNLIEHPPLLENVVKLTIVSPILFIAGFYLSPFQIKAEKSIQIKAEDEGVILEGRIDILLLKENFWVTVIESKQFAFSLEEGVAQILAYMLADPHPETPTFGLLTNGVNFTFVKLVQAENPQFALSDEFVIRNKKEDLYNVVQILKHLSNLAGN
ncbi:MAG: restriction endonuclease subunit R [Oscillatoria sp. PMC 1068.18]|nr:restriction endonuclease subunit R [Oscillatoria sp. PMC 1076.18]MEC4990624.1 restriction endonuclease subunit R [Oscillatoria sp. PMC 1068.18]